MARTDAEALAELARGRLRAKLPDLRKALDGRVQAHHRVLLQHILAHIDFLEESLAQLHEELEPYLAPFAEAVKAGPDRGGHRGDSSCKYHCRDWSGYDPFCF